MTFFSSAVMERRTQQPLRRSNEYPSFSSKLLDVIYRSIDESDAGGEFYRSSSAPQRSSRAFKKQLVTDRLVNRPCSLQLTSTSSSSENSSSGGFSSSELDSAARHRARVRPIRVASWAATRSAVSFLPLSPSPPRPVERAPSRPEEKHLEMKKSSSIRSKLRDLVSRVTLGRSKAPMSPGARLANLLSSLFPNAAGRRRKPKTLATSAGDDSTCPTASSCCRSCHAKKPSSRWGVPSEDESLKRSVVFHPVSVIVGADLRSRNQKMACKGDRTATMVSEEVRQRSVAAATVAKEKGREAGRLKIEDILRSFEEEEDEAELSDSSSDLFELENLTVTGGGGAVVTETNFRCTGRQFLVQTLQFLVVSRDN